MSFPLGHLPGISDSLGSRWSTRSLLKPDLSPRSTISWFIQTLNPESSPLPRQSFIMSYCSKPPIATSSPSFLVKTSISTVVLTGLPTANLAHFHFITQLERSLKNKNQIVPTPTWNTPATSLHSEKKIPTPSSAVVVVTVCCPDPPWDQELTAESLPRQGASSSKVIRGKTPSKLGQCRGAKSGSFASIPDRYSAPCSIVWDLYCNCIIAHRFCLPSLISLPSSQVLYLRIFPRKPPACKSPLRV